MLSFLENYNSTDRNEDTGAEQEQQQALNAATTLNVQNETLKLLQELQKQLFNLSTEVKKKGGEKSKKDYKKTVDNPSFTRTITDKYCWTHGACNHESKDCTRQATGHRVEATKTNKLGGSKAFCE